MPKVPISPPIKVGNAEELICVLYEEVAGLVNDVGEESGHDPFLNLIPIVSAVKKQRMKIAEKDEYKKWYDAVKQRVEGAIPDECSSGVKDRPGDESG